MGPAHPRAVEAGHDAAVLVLVFGRHGGRENEATKRDASGYSIVHDKQK